ncbi:endosomal/lysosomal proton channel TMEM175-like [Dysidea avara]|uniref:endosomal/lysosomal proton channel TMEM175-like n=1 Tax=Dysidea avara TaxID=196820 RepID=UPI00332EEE4C
MAKLNRNSAMESPTEAREEELRTAWEMEMFSQYDVKSRRRESEHFRRHEFLGVRLQSYTDAVFAIVGTILIAYLNQTVVPRLTDGSNSLQQRAIDNFRFFSVYHFTFLHISVIWLNHSRLFLVIERVNDVLIWMNMVFLYVVSFVPLAFGLLGEFSDTYEGIVIPSIVIILINTIMASMIWYVFRRKSFLLPSGMSDIHAKYFEWTMYFKLSITPIFVSLAIGFGKVSLLAGQVLFYSSLFVVIIPKVVAYCIWWRNKTDLNKLIVQLLSGTVSKDRIEFFTDGVYSIIATLIILDVTTVGIPSWDAVNEKFNGSLVRALSDNRIDYVYYFSTFWIISLLWFVHHSLFNFIKVLNPLMFLTHQCSLSFVGVVPGSVALWSDIFRSNISDADEATAIQIAVGAIAIVSLLQFLLLALMSFAKDKCVDQSVFHYSGSSLYLLVKVAIIPTICVIGFWCSMGSESIRRHSFYILYISIPLAFVFTNIMIKFTKLHVFCKYCWNKLQNVCCICTLFLCNCACIRFHKNL